MVRGGKRWEVVGIVGRVGIVGSHGKSRDRRRERRGDRKRKGGSWLEFCAHGVCVRV